MDYQLIGSTCGQHGPYTFYKAFKYTKNCTTNILAVSEFFFVKLWPDSDLISIGELQLLWTDKNSEQTLASLRLYILPENTPDGRTDIHGEDEVLAISEKVVLRVDDLLTWIHVAPDWHWGQKAVWSGDALPSLEVKEEVKEEVDPDHPKINEEPPEKERVQPAISTDPPLYPRHKSVDMDDVLSEKQKLGLSHWESTPGVVVLSFARYCRYRGLLKRLEGVYNKWLRHSLIQALGGFTSPFKNTRVLFCKDTFDYPELEGHELLCNHLAPKLKGRNANKRKKKEISASEEEEDSESDSCESSASSGSSSSNKPALQIKAVGVKPRLRCTLEVGNRVVTTGPTTILNLNSGLDGIKNSNLMDEKKFLQGLHAYMRARNTPIGRIPVVGFKEVNLYKLYRKVIEFGGYDVVTNNKMWKQVYQVTGGDMSCTSAATLSRRHYEKLLLPYERFLKNKASTLVIPSTYSLSHHARIAQLSGAVKISPLRTGMVQGKTLLQVKTEKPREKENIPERMKRPPEAMLNSSVTIIKKEIKDDVDLVSPDTSPVKPIVTIKPAPVKKQKLDMLKQGGLEVTAVALGGGPGFPSKSETPSNDDKASTKKDQRTTPPPNIKNNNKVSITVTPDICHLGGGNSSGSNGAGGSNGNKVSITVTPDMSHLMYPWGVMNVNGPGTSKQKSTNNSTVVYGAGSAVGLPVEAVLGGQPAPSTSAPIDLRTSKAKKPNIGSNLEISLIPSGVKKSAIQNSNARTNQRTPQRYNNPRFNSPIYTLKTSPNAAPYVPLIDPAYLCGNIVTQKLPQFTAPNPATSSPASINSFYKDLLRSQGIFNLLPDGSTSISLVGGQSTPTSK